ncbi:hypothetical protein TeGR_g1228 [Tetraparma gracilis]|uniref:F-box domain-containing protein n=1 Tax=Tetraparma gracilis TaxID=2962635 RepID=A0ABQ6MJE9_9STRA|nr:hypothetical protein TeGR_g1228 [Tetraparma gracilis]
MLAWVTCRGLTCRDAALYLLLAALTYITVHRRELSANDSSRRSRGKAKVEVPDDVAAASDDEQDLASTTTAIAAELYAENVGLLNDGLSLASSLAATAAARTGAYLQQSAEDHMAESISTLLPPPRPAPPTPPPPPRPAPRPPSHAPLLSCLAADLSADNLISICSFLSPPAVLSLTACSRPLKQLGEGVLWRVLWKLHFEPVLGFAAAQEAYRRKPRAKPLGDFEPPNLPWRDFYFLFGATWLPWAIAGRNGDGPGGCLVGLHGAVSRLGTKTKSRSRFPLVRNRNGTLLSVRRALDEGAEAFSREVEGWLRLIGGEGGVTEEDVNVIYSAVDGEFQLWYTEPGRFGEATFVSGKLT